MNTIKRIIATIFILSCYLLSNAQQSHHHASQAQWMTQHKKEIGNIGYIFEGKVIQQTGKAFTCSTMQITKIYKGSPEIKIGTIKILTEQNPNTKDGWKGLSKSATYIIFGIIDSNKTFNSLKADNPLTLKCFDCIYFLGQGTARWGGTEYSTLDSIYSFFKENGLTVQEEEK